MALQGGFRMYALNLTVYIEIHNKRLVNSTQNVLISNMYDNHEVIACKIKVIRMRQMLQLIQNFNIQKLIKKIFMYLF